MSSPYKTPFDIANRACQHLKVPRISTFSDMSPPSNELGFSYDKVRQYELRRNHWRFATRRAVLRAIDQTTMHLAPSLWSATVAYTAGSIVDYPIGTSWICNAPNTGEVPSVTTLTASGRLVWDSYFGPLTASMWNAPCTPEGTPYFEPVPGPGFTGSSAISSVFYQPGELVYMVLGSGVYTIFQCLRATNDAPMVADVWESTRVYQQGQIVSFIESPQDFTLGVSLLSGDPLGAGNYQSTMNVNIGNQPDQTQVSGGAPAFNITAAYSVGDIIVGSDNQLYQATTASTGQDPTLDGLAAYWQPLNQYLGAWTATIVPANAALSNAWQLIYATLSPIVFSYPIGAGPARDIETANVFRLPANWLRESPADPHRGQEPILGGPSGNLADDWTYEGDYIVSSQTWPILLRFVADIQDVTMMDAMFCEALAISLAVETGSAVGSVENVAPKYQLLVQDARTVDAIEQGPIEQTEDEYIRCRI